MQTEIQFENIDSQKKQILAALEGGNKLTPLEIMRRFNCLRASARIFDLRQEGHPIKTNRVKKGNALVAEYSL
jgi:hypothetical protein